MVCNRKIKLFKDFDGKSPVQNVDKDFHFIYPIV